jgi:hypothetical protein
VRRCLLVRSPQHIRPHRSRLRTAYTNSVDRVLTACTSILCSRERAVGRNVQ